MIVRIVSILCVVAFLQTGCAPRGESYTLDEVLEKAHRRYVKALSATPALDQRKALDALSELLNKFIKDPQNGVALSASISEGLQDLIPETGIPTRPAMREIIFQYMEMSRGEEEVNNSRAKLLASRTYSLLAAELETTGFRVKPLA